MTFRLVAAAGLVSGALAGFGSSLVACDAGCEIPEPPSEGSFTVIDSSDPAMIGAEVSVRWPTRGPVVMLAQFTVDDVPVEVEYEYLFWKDPSEFE